MSGLQGDDGFVGATVTRDEVGQWESHFEDPRNLRCMFAGSSHGSDRPLTRHV